MSLYKGIKSPSAIYKGTKEISAIYKGNSLVWQNKLAPGFYDIDGNLLTELTKEYLEMDMAGDASFSWTDNITTDAIKKNTAYIVFPENLTKIGRKHFSYFYNLREIVIPEGVTIIGDGAFYYTENVEKIIIPNGVTSLGEDSFSMPEGTKKESKVTAVNIPNTVTLFNVGCFSHRRFDSIYIEPGDKDLIIKNVCLVNAAKHITLGRNVVGTKGYTSSTFSDEGPHYNRSWSMQDNYVLDYTLLDNVKTTFNGQNYFKGCMSGGTFQIICQTPSKWKLMRGSTTLDASNSKTNGSLIAGIASTASSNNKLMLR